MIYFDKGGLRMNVFEGFSAFNFDEGVPYVSVTKNGVSFNKSVIMKLNYPSNVVLLINPESKKIAIKCCDESTPNSVAFYKNKENSNVLCVRWNAKDLLDTIEKMMEWDLESSGYRAGGILLNEEKAMLFDLSMAKSIK